MSGRDARWEFPKQLLFQRTNYMADICKDLAEMVEVVDDFFKFLGPELKAVTGDTQGIDRCESLITIEDQRYSQHDFSLLLCARFWSQRNSRRLMERPQTISNDRSGCTYVSWTKVFD